MSTHLVTVHYVMMNEEERIECINLCSDVTLALPRSLARAISILHFRCEHLHRENGSLRRSMISLVSVILSFSCRMRHQLVQ